MCVYPGKADVARHIFAQPTGAQPAAGAIGMWMPLAKVPSIAREGRVCDRPQVGDAVEAFS